MRYYSIRYIFTFITLSISIFAFSQTNTQKSIDSLRTILDQQKEPEERLGSLKQLNALLINESNPQKSLSLFIEMLQLSQKTSNYSLISKSFRYISDCYLNVENETQAIQYAQESLNLNDSLKNLEEYIIDINRLGATYHHFRKYNKAIATFKQGLKKYNKEGNESALSSIPQIYMNLSISYGKLNNVEEKTKYLIQGIEIADRMSFFKQKSHALYNLGYTYMELGHYSKAEEYFAEALRCADSLHLPEFYVNCNHHALGINYSRWGKYDKAIKHNLIALESFRKRGVKLYEFDVLNNMAIAYQRKRDLNMAVIYAKYALDIAGEIKHPLAINGALQTLSNLYIDKGQFIMAEEYLKIVAKDTCNSQIFPLQSLADYYQKISIIEEHKNSYRNAFKALKRFKTLNDSINKLKAETKFIETETKYQTAQKEKENLKLKQEKEQQIILLQKENLQKKLSLFALLATLSALGLFIFYNIRHRKQTLLIKHLQKELHHRIKNNLSIINRFVNVLREEFDEPKFDHKLRDLQNRINSINEVHSLLHKDKKIDTLNISQYVQQLSESVKYSFPNNKITIHNNIPQHFTLSSSKSFPLGIIINEFLTNTFKYAFDNKEGDVFIELKEDKDLFYCKISDNGKGLPDNFNISTDANFGFRISRLLVLQIGGEIEVINKNGVQLHISFPKK